MDQGVAGEISEKVTSVFCEQVCECVTKKPTNSVNYSGDADSDLAFNLKPAYS